MLTAAVLAAAGCSDSSATDAGGVDAGGVDASRVDAGDAGAPDVGAPDVGLPDAGPAPYGLEELIYNEDCVVETVNPDGTIDVAPTVSATGCYASIEDLTVVPALIPFDINSALWTDGALKRRFFALPPGTTVELVDDLAWDFPIGTILMKEFILATDERDPSARFLMETRFLVKYEDRFWRGYSYRWNEDGTEAELLDNIMEGITGEYEVRQADGSTRTHEHLFPGRSQCLQCHAPRANGANGLQTAQMNRDFDYTEHGGAAIDNQLRTYEHIGVFSAPLPDLPENMARMVDPTDEAAPLELRARAYIHANCAHCHRREGSAITSTLWIPYDAPLEDTNACIGRAGGGTPGEACDSVDTRIVPGDTAGSLLTCLMTAGDMPPVGTLLPDPARRVVFDWIESLASCP